MREQKRCAAFHRALGWRRFPFSPPPAWWGRAHRKKTRKKTHTHAHLLFSLSFTHSTGKELNARRSAKQLESRGEKFRALKAKEAAKKAAAQAASAGGGGGSGGGNGAAAQAEAAPAPKAGAVATDPARPVVPDAPPPKNNSGTGGSA